MSFMKRSIKILLAAILVIATTNAWAQTAWDAYRYSQQFNEGTARSVAMGNAMVALGGDMGAITINPAASGVYRYHEFVFTPSVTVAAGQADYLGTITSDSKTRFGVPNFGYVASFTTGRKKSGLINWNLAFAFNKTNNFTSRMSVSGRTAESSWLGSLANSTNGIYAPDMDMNSMNDPFYTSDAGWTSILGWNTSLMDTLPDSPYDYIAATENINGYDIAVGGELDQHFMKESIGSISEATLNFGGNISNKLFFGVNLGITSIWYKYNEIYSESAVNPNQFDSQFRDFSHYYGYSTSGTGVNLKAGLIYLPVKGLRLGASISTPTWMFLYEEWEEQMSANFADGYSQSLTSPLGTYNYKLNSPFRWNIGAAYTFGKFGVVSIDYENANYSRMRLQEDYETDYAYDVFGEENRYIRNTFGSSNIIRAGIEINASQQLAIRGGYQYYSSGIKNDKTSVQVGSLGLGYTARSGFFADIAYQKQFANQESFQLYDDITGSDNNIITAAPVGSNKSGNWKLLLSIGLKF